ncbi:Lrp/AsnC family transcriptional regulator [Nocardia sp. NPDC058633]|uniref:Lrp/AsnC family transcriptional regulator n=1 Tax=Nocardia sp. NPDC058633 TaxID=3346568 RepID=UPI003663B125
MDTEVPESGNLAPSAPDSRFSELDLALIDALQTAPRAAWSQVGKALGIDATTVARRWDRLRAEGMAWITAYESAKTTTVAFVEVRCRPQAMDAVSAAVTALPWVFSVEETAGDYDLLLSVGAPDLPTLGRWTRRDIGALPGLRSTRTRVGITLFSEGADWQIRAMGPAQRATLSTERPSSRTSYSSLSHNRPSAEDQALLTALGADGRLSYTALGVASGLSEHTARRRVHRMIRDGELLVRCDLAHPLAGLPTSVSFRMSVPHADLEAAGSTLARQANVRLCASVSGPHNLFVQVVLHGLHGIDAFETLLAERLPTLRVKDRTITLKSAKRLGWLLDEQGRAIGRVPLGPPQNW